MLDCPAGVCQRRLRIVITADATRLKYLGGKDFLGACLGRAPMRLLRFLRSCREITLDQLCGFEAVRCAELANDAIDVSVNRPVADVELAPDLLRREAPAHQGHDLALSHRDCRPTLYLRMRLIHGP